MHLRAILFANFLVLASFTTACAGELDDNDESQGPAQSVEVTVQDGTLSAKDKKTTTTTTTTTTSSSCVGSKVKTACNQQAQVNDFLRQ